MKERPLTPRPTPNASSRRRMVVKGIDINEKELAERVATGSQAAARQLYSCYVRYLTAVCSRYIADDESLKDVLQDSFLKIFSSVGSFQYRGEGSLKGWMTRIALNESLKFLRQAGRLQFADLRDEMNAIPDDNPDTTAVPSNVIHSIIRSLPDGYRTIFNLYVIEEKSHKEISTLLNIKESTSASQLHRAKAMLATRIKQYLNQNP